jgi:hypothetical protein
VFDRIGCGIRHVGYQCRRFVGDLLGNMPNASMLAVNNGANRITQVAQQVPPVGDLNGIRRPLAGAVCVGAGAIAGNDLNTGMAAQPCGQAFGLSIGQQVDNRIALQINQDRPVAVSATPRPIIDGKDARNWRRFSTTGKPCQGRSPSVRW